MAIAHCTFLLSDSPSTPVALSSTSIRCCPACYSALHINAATPTPSPHFCTRDPIRRSTLATIANLSSSCPCEHLVPRKSTVRSPSCSTDFPLQHLP
ncbi:hypothetical protein BCR44DRAFT_1447852 [Catenaria anguillulae PL171]|uniref:Uncharacterized protein n=1 Tax=Catenaria anguillulae PL171 TaxID=765915 RepID=A0A1Y2H7V1_9FUNG|nr:hypothetical protein BCR44DRAFT_1447852 [Catenaria anguillulae PL171]